MRLLLDTTYLMPLSGIETDKFTKEDSKILFSAKNIYFLVSPVSLIELKWIIISKSKGNPVLRSKLRKEYRYLLEFLRYTTFIKLTPLVNEQIDEEENRLLDLGIKDYFDRIIFSTALVYADALLTENNLLRNVWNIHKNYRDSIDLYSWKELRNILRP